MTAATDRIERKIIINAPRSRVWQSLTNAEEFGKWFGVAFRAKQSFVAGQVVTEKFNKLGCEHLDLQMVIERVEPETLFSWRWHPYGFDTSVDFSTEPMTLVEFTLQEIEGGTLVKVAESGFDQVWPQRRDEAYRGNSRGWEVQMENLRKYVCE